MKLTLEYKKARKERLVASRPSMARAQPRSHEPLGRFRSPMRPIVGHAIGQRPETARYKVARCPDALLALASAGTDAGNRLRGMGKEDGTISCLIPVIRRIRCQLTRVTTFVE